MKNLVIVESPTKAKTISKFLPKDYKVESSYGHVRDLPGKKLGVDVENNFEPTYEDAPRAKKQITLLKNLAKTSDKIYFATDEDREGEAIAWHLKHILKPKNYERITFHEITKKAIMSSLESPRDLDMDLVDAQQARRILDRLVGYKLSPFLWKKVARGLSAGRVQSVTVRLIVEKEREIEAFKADEYWTLEAVFETKDKVKFEAKLHAKDGKSLKKLEINNEKQAKEIEELLNKSNYKVASVEQKQSKKKVPEPFKTSTLQQTANNRLHFSSKQTMMLAQQLYEGIKLGDKDAVGLITYMRTDSLTLSTDFLSATHDYIIDNLGKEYAPEKSRVFKTKSKNAQEAHEAIRPTHVEFTPEEMRSHLNDKQFKLYQLIWQRTVASQMKEAVVNATTIDINTEKDEFTFRATGQILHFDGFLKVYPTDTKENILPDCKESDPVSLDTLESKQHFTQPPARYTEASLVKVLEEFGIGRPSTYAPTIATVQDRNYVVKEEKKLKPTDIGTIVTDILVEHFKDIVDYTFTAEMEEDLDKIAEGKKKWQPIIKAFYTPFIKNLEKKDKELTKKELTEVTTEELCEKCESPMVIKTGRFGRFMACTGYPECKNTKPVEGEENEKEPELSEEECPECGNKLAKKHGRFGAFLGCSSYPDCKFIKKFSQSTGVKCPECGEGEIVTRKGRSKKIFYACNKYPKCKYTLWGKPTGEKCKLCHGLLIHKGKSEVCGNTECESNSKETEEKK
jgi:DNA topoisomerase I